MKQVAPIESKKENGFEKYELENAVDTLMRAHEIKEDEKLMKAVAPILKRKMAGMKAAISSLDDIRAVRQNRAQAELDGEEE